MSTPHSLICSCNAAKVADAAAEPEFANFMEFVEGFHSDHLIDVYVAGTPQPYKVQQSILFNTSDYFAKAIKHEASLGSGTSGVLRFPEDHSGAWCVLLHWMFKSGLPDMDSQPTQDVLYILVHLWILGDKYDIKKVQDLAMLELLSKFESITADLELVKVAFDKTPPGSKLRLFMAEEVAYRMRYLDFKTEELKVFDSTTDFTIPLVQAMKRVEAEGRAYGGWRLGGKADDTPVWKQYMVGYGPDKHWIHEYR